jgi:hypothetical protein
MERKMKEEFRDELDLPQATNEAELAVARKSRRMLIHLFGTRPTIKTIANHRSPN